VLFGPPGCGKTSYLRGLMSRLIRRFDFYYLPVSPFDVLSNPTFVNFWIERADGGIFIPATLQGRSRDLRNR
jgi:ATPase family associated with various cellular activities (AAA)